MNQKNNYLIHWGIKGQKWGIRRYQNEDGSYTAKGQAENGGHGRYSDSDTKSSKNKKNQNGVKKSGFGAKFKAKVKEFISEEEQEKEEQNQEKPINIKNSVIIKMGEDAIKQLNLDDFDPDEIDLDDDSYWDDFDSDLLDDLDEFYFYDYDDFFSNED